MHYWTFLDWYGHSSGGSWSQPCAGRSLEGEGDKASGIAQFEMRGQVVQFLGLENHMCPASNQGVGVSDGLSLHDYSKQKD